jgi:hypothetical protein
MNDTELAEKRLAWAKHLEAEVLRLRGALAYTASLLTCRMEGDDIPTRDIREYALDVIDMTVGEAMATTDLGGEDE